ncbi:MAG: hypothetical protein ACLFSB_15975 [Chitinispirillaceae bacterium]
MPGENHVIMGVHIHDRVNQAPDIQKVFTQYGCNIKTRLGLHDVNGDFCSVNGLILLEMTGDFAKFEEMAAKLNAFEGVEVQRMDFSHN